MWRIILFIGALFLISCEQEEGTDWLAVYIDLNNSGELNGTYELESYEAFDRIYETDSCSTQYFDLFYDRYNWYQDKDCVDTKVLHSGELTPRYLSGRPQNRIGYLGNPLGQASLNEFRMTDETRFDENNRHETFANYIIYVDEERLEFQLGFYDIDGDGIYLEEVRFNWRKLE